MEIADALIVSQPLPDNHWSWTLTSRLGELLKLAQAEFGNRDMTYTPLGFELTADGPYIWYLGDPANRYAIIRLNNACANDEVQACYQLAQECIHLLSPTGGSHANCLEEGLSIVFAARYIKGNFGVPMFQQNPKYAGAANLVETLLAFDPEAIRKARAIQPSFSQITVETLRACLSPLPS